MLASGADSMRMILCQKLLFDQVRDRRFPVHEILFPYDSVTRMIRRGDFKRLDHELETGTTKGMQNFEHSLKQREYEGWTSSHKRKTGFSEHEVAEFLYEQAPLDEEADNLTV